LFQRILYHLFVPILGRRFGTETRIEGRRDSLGECSRFVDQNPEQNFGHDQADFGER
jgi:hypothetical protein